MRRCRSLFVLMILAAACGGGKDGPTGPTGPATGANPSLGYVFTADPGIRASGFQPSTLVLNGTIYMYLSSQLGTLMSTDGLTFTPAPAAFTHPLGSSYSFVALSDGRTRMYYFDPPTAHLLSAISSDRTRFLPEDGVRMTLTGIAVPKVVATPTGVRVYYTTDAGISSASSSDGLNFTLDPGLRLASGSSYNWGDPAVINTGSGWLMLATDLPRDQSYSSIWLSSSTDGLTWTLDAKPLISSPAGSPIDASFLPVGSGYRVYYGFFAGASGTASSVQSQVMSGLVSR